MNPGRLHSPASPRRALLIVAVPAEARVVLSAFGSAALTEPWRVHELADHLDLAVSGVGKVNAAAAAALLLHRSRHAGVVSLGVAGALPGSGLEPGDVVVASASIYADEGLLTPDSFRDCAAMGFPLGPFHGSEIPSHPDWAEALALAATDAEHAPHVAPVATVSTCSGTDALAATVRDRTGARAEAMEGAAVAHVAARLGFPSAELRVISNTTGDRDRQRWDLAGALAVLGRIAAGL